MKKERFALVLGITIISFYPILAKLNGAPSFITAFYRMAIACGLLLPYVFFTKKLNLPNLTSVLFALFSGIFIASDVAVWNIAIKESSATQATLLLNLAPIWVGIGSYLFLKNKPGFNFWLGALIALLGMAVIIGLKVFYKLEFNQALIYGVLAGVFYASYIITSKKALNQMDVLSFFSVSLLSSTIYLGVINLLVGNKFTGYSNITWGLLLFKGVFIQLIAWLLISFAIKNMRATRVSLSLLSQAFLSAVFAWFFLKEEISLQMIFGGLLLLLGIAVTFLPKQLISFKNEDFSSRKDAKSQN